VKPEKGRSISSLRICQKLRGFPNSLKIGGERLRCKAVVVLQLQNKLMFIKEELNKWNKEVL